MQYLCVTVPPAVRPTLLWQVGMGSDHENTIWIYNLHLFKQSTFFRFLLSPPRYDLRLGEMVDNSQAAIFGSKMDSRIQSKMTPDSFKFDSANNYMTAILLLAASCEQGSHAVQIQQQFVVASLSWTLWGSPSMCTPTPIHVQVQVQSIGWGGYMCDHFQLPRHVGSHSLSLEDFIFVSREWGLLCQERILAEETPHTTRHNNCLM